MKANRIGTKTFHSQSNIDYYKDFREFLECIIATFLVGASSNSRVYTYMTENN